MADLDLEPKVIFVDIDDTICKTTNELHPTLPSRNYEKAEPMLDRIAKINSLYDAGHTIIFWTARGTMTNIPWFHVTKTQLDRWGCKYHELRMGKPFYDLFIDDKNIESDRFFYHFKT